MNVLQEYSLETHILKGSSKIRKQWTSVLLCWAYFVQEMNSFFSDHVKKTARKSEVFITSRLKRGCQKTELACLVHVRI